MAYGSPEKAAEPGAARIAVVTSTFVVAIAAFFFAGRQAADVLLTPVGFLASIACGAIAALLIGSLGEWMVHRYIMHHRLVPPLHLAYDLHHRAHHWIQYPPSEYLHQDQVQRVPVSRDLSQVCRTRIGRLLTVAMHVSFYSIFGVALALVPSIVFTGNWVFSLAVSAVTAVEICLFVRVHDAVHHPGLSRLERFGWFRFLDRHHYIHHVDNRANTNFLLPLCDLLMGVLRRELTPKELARWPTYEEARHNVVHPLFDDHGRRIRALDANQVISVE